MGWKAFGRDGSILIEDVDGRPVQAGEEGKLLCITQEDFGRKVAVDLDEGAIYIDYEGDISVQNGTLEISNYKFRFLICEETNIVGEYKHLDQRIEWARDEDGKRLRDENSNGYKVRTDYLTPLIWRPVWFSRVTNGGVTKVVGCQTTTPEMQGAKNVKCMVSIFNTGEIGISM